MAETLRDVVGGRVPHVRAAVSVEPIRADHLIRTFAGEDVTLDVRLGEKVIGTVPLPRRQVLAAMAPEHPSLAFQVNGTLLAHRRAGAGLTVCRREGELTVVLDDGIPPCPKCYQTT